MISEGAYGVSLGALWVKKTAIRAAVFGGLFLSAVGVHAQESSPRELLDPSAQAEWQAVGRINVAGRSFCTGTLIAPDLVLTVAHCLYNRRTGSLPPATEVHFLAGYRMGDYTAHRTASRIAIASGYRPTAPVETVLGSDMAILTLVEPITGIPPIAVAEDDNRFRKGARVFTLSYGMDRPEALSIEGDCRITDAAEAVLFTSCEATPGVSGGPLLSGDGETARVIGIVVAMAGRVRGQAIAIPLGGEFRSLLTDSVNWASQP